MKEILLEELQAFCEKALIKSGVNTENARTITEVLVTTDTFGVLSHGTKNLYQYILKMNAGGLDPKAEPTIEAEGPAWAIINGNNAAGMVSSTRAMKLAVEKAKTTGISYVGVKNSCHFGAAGYYSNLAAKEGMIGISMSNADPNMAIPNSADVVIGNNPFSFAAPLPNGKSVFLDIALSSVAALKIIMAKEKGEQVPREWLIDSEGRPTSDPSGFPKNSHLQPMAAHKGYGLAIMVEILASVITCSGLLSQVPSWNLDMTSKNNVGHAFIAIDAGKMLPTETFLVRMEQIVREMKSAPKAKDAQQIFVPGEMEWTKREKALQTGRITLTDAMVENMEKLSKLTGISIRWM
jgi:ureidoglycolate dehydrogenase (NAD+)